MPAGIPGGYERYLAPTGPNGAYYPQALFVSSRGFGFMLNQPEYSRWRMGNDRRGAWQVQVSARELDYTVALGPTPRAAVRTLTAINGRHRLPPAWAQGPMLVRAAAVPALPGQPAPETRASYQAKIEGDLADMTRYGVQAERLRVRGLGAARHGLRARADPAAARARRALGRLPPGLRVRRRPLHAGAGRLPGDVQLRVRGHPPGGAARTCSARTAAPPPRCSTSSGGPPCAGGAPGSSCCWTRAPTASCRTSASRCRTG